MAWSPQLIDLTRPMTRETIIEIAGKIVAEDSPYNEVSLSSCAAGTRTTEPCASGRSTTISARISTRPSMWWRTRPASTRSTSTG